MANIIMGNGFPNSLIPSAYASEFTGYFSSDISSEVGSYPILGIFLPSGSSMYHDVMITGLGFDGQYTYIDSATGQYASGYPSMFVNTFVVTGLNPKGK
jgi:hypothetical protein